MRKIHIYFEVNNTRIWGRHGAYSEYSTISVTFRRQETILYKTNKNKQERNIYNTLFLNLLMIRMETILLHPNLH